MTFSAALEADTAAAVLAEDFPVAEAALEAVVLPAAGSY